MPTGGGKSVTFQVPALAMEGICLVITPLIALMRDQVDNLRRVGIKATAVYSGMGRQEIVAELENCVSGQYKFLYVSPERLATGLFREKLQAMNVCLLVVDEAIVSRNGAMTSALPISISPTFGSNCPACRYWH